MNRIVRILGMGVAAGLGLTLGLAVLELPEPTLRLAEQVSAHMDVSGVAHPVTAVLLNFRGYDTMLEIAVLLLALLGVLSAGAGTPLTGLLVSDAPPRILQASARIMTPLMILVAGYLLWAGSDRSGGAFQAGAVLAAIGVLLYLAGLLPDWSEPGPRMRFGLTAGFLLFLAVASQPLLSGTLLQYPPQWAGALIFATEAGLTLSLALILSGLFLWLPNEAEDAEAE